MTATSDLDLIVVYDFDRERPESSGPRPLYGAQYFSRLTQRLISALTAQTNHGLLYQVDMRLRPSGRSGPLATQIDGFASYQENEAWTWEHMALTRARVVSASPAFAARVEERDPRRALPAARRGDGRRRRPRDAQGDRDREGRQRPLGSQIRRRRADRHRVHRAVSAARSRLRRCRIFSTLRPRACSTRHGGSACSRPRTPRCCARRCGFITISRRFCACACRGRSIPKRPRRASSACLARAADVPDFATLDAFLVETQAKVRASFIRILRRIAVILSVGGGR